MYLLCGAFALGLQEVSFCNTSTFVINNSTCSSLRFGFVPSYDFVKLLGVESLNMERKNKTTIYIVIMQTTGNFKYVLATERATNFTII